METQETQFKARYDQIKEIPNDTIFCIEPSSFAFFQEQLFTMGYRWIGSGQCIVDYNLYSDYYKFFIIDVCSTISFVGDSYHYRAKQWSEFFTLKPEFKGLLASKRLGL